jgi:hypothetical protein
MAGLPIPPTLSQMVPSPGLLREPYGAPRTVALTRVTELHGPFGRVFHGIDSHHRLWRLEEPAAAFAPWTLTVALPADLQENVSEAQR